MRSLKLKTYAQNTLTTITSILLFTGILEMGVRIFVPEEHDYNFPLFESHKKFGFTLKPNQSKRLNQPEYSHLITTNAYGFRDIEIDFESKTPKAIFLGDSFTMGQGVEENKRFTHLIGQHVQDYQIVNLGIMGYSSINQYYVLKEIGRRLRPKHVILAIHRSDLFESIDYPFYKVKNNHLSFTTKQDPNTSRASEVLKQSKLVKQISYRFKNKLYYYVAPRGLKKHFLNIQELNYFRPEKKTELHPQYENVFQYILKMKEYCDSLSSEFTAILIPSREAIYPGKSLKNHSTYGEIDFFLIQDTFNNFFKQNKIRFIPLISKMREEARNKKSQPLYYDIDKHLNSIGHRVLYEVLIQQNLLVEKN